MRRKGLPYSNLEQKGVDLPVTASSIRRLFFTEVNCGLRVTITEARMSGIRLFFEYEVSPEDDQLVYATGATLHVPISRNGSILRNVPGLDRIFEKIKE